MNPNTTTETCAKATPLRDLKVNGKEMPWREKKTANVGYYELLELLNFKKAERVADCGDILEFKKNEEGRLKLARAWFCKSPLCPLCNWRKSMKRSAQTRIIVERVVREKPKARWLFLTLTVRNAIDGEHLDESLKAMAQGFNRLMKYKKVSKNMVGFMRSTEVTVNEKDGTYNQHMHVLLCVEPDYFKKSANYINQKEWTSLWQKAMKLNYVPMVNVKAVKEKYDAKDAETVRDALEGKAHAMQGAVAETAKYSVKDSDYLTGDNWRDMGVVRDLEQGLRRKRMVSYGGRMKVIHKELNLSDVENGDLVKVDESNEETEEKASSVFAWWHWQQQNYFLRK